jgi:hypothetical protein
MRGYYLLFTRKDDLKIFWPGVWNILVMKLSSPESIQSVCSESRIEISH